MYTEQVRSNLENFQIETARLLLVPITMEYAEEIFRVFDDEITRYMYPATPGSIEDTRIFIRKSIEGFSRGEEIVAAILTKDAREFIGNVGIHDINTSTPELGIWIKKDAHGHGYGKEAVTGLKEWADTALGYEYIKYPVVEENIPSRAIAESLNGKEVLRYPKTNLSGVTHAMVEYYIHPNVPHAHQ